MIIFIFIIIIISGFIIICNSNKINNTTVLQYPDLIQSDYNKFENLNLGKTYYNSSDDENDNNIIQPFFL